MSSSCSVQTPCEAQGGVCTARNVECGATQRFVGYDPACEPMSKCCVPLSGSPSDAGTSCAGVCFNSGHVCESGTTRVDGGSCPSQGTCCNKVGASCATMGGKCQSQDLACVKILGGVERCGSGNQCCAK